MDLDDTVVGRMLYEPGYGGGGVRARLEALDKLAQGLHPQAACQMVVQGGQGRPEQVVVVRESGVGAYRALTSDLQIQPADGMVARIQGGGDPPRHTRRRIAFPNVGDPHPVESNPGATRHGAGE